jgi:hypothetical protein
MVTEGQDKSGIARRALEAMARMFGKSAPTVEARQDAARLAELARQWPVEETAKEAKEQPRQRAVDVPMTFPRGAFSPMQVLRPELLPMEMPLGTATYQILYWNNTTKKWALLEPPAANSVLGWTAAGGLVWVATTSCP